MQATFQLAAFSFQNAYSRQARTGGAARFRGRWGGGVFQKETDMATFVPISGRGAQSVYVNPERVNYIRIRNEKTVLYFDKDQAVETDDPVSTVLAALSLSAS
jgi:hypothetical protein